MRKGLLGWAAALFVGAGTSLAQTTDTPPADHAPVPTASAPDLIHDHPAPPAGFPISADGCTGIACDGPTLACDCCRCPPLGPSGRFWVTAEYLLWWIRNDHVPPLVTTGPATFPVGFLGNPGTTVLFGGGDLGHSTFSGARFNAGYWFNDCQTCGIVGNFFFLGQRSNDRTFTSADFPVLARPFFNVNSGTQFSEFSSFPGISTGSVTIENPSRLWGTGVNLVKTLCCNCWSRVNALGGFQYLDLQESVNIIETASFLPTAPFPGLAGSSFLATDHFGTRNQFYGGQLGLAGWAWRGPWFVNVNSLVGLGSTHQVIEINGSQVATTPAGTATFAGGLLALPSNSGRFTRDEFSVVPQVGLNVGRQIGRHVTVFLGYTFLYWSNVVRPGDQIDPVLNINQIPNFGVTGPAAPARPIVPFKETDFWTQGINFGLGFYW